MEFRTCCNKCRLLGHFSCRKSHTFLDTCFIASAPGRFTVVAAHLNSVSFLTVLQESACGGLAECLRRMLSTEVLPHPIRVHSDFPTFQSGCLETRHSDIDISWYKTKINCEKMGWQTAKSNGLEIPNITKNYNMNMGGRDLNNMLAALYRIEHKSRKWTRRIFFWIINTAMTNAWQLYKRGSKEMPGTCTGTMNLLSFTYHVSHSLCLVNKPIATSRSHFRASSPTLPPLTSRRLGRRPSDVSREVAKDQTSHWPEITQTRRRCRLCSKLATCLCKKCSDLEMSSPNTFCIIPKFYGLRWKLGRKSYEESLPEQDSDLWERPGLKSPYDNAYDHTRRAVQIDSQQSQKGGRYTENNQKIVASSAILALHLITRSHWFRFQPRQQRLMVDTTSLLCPSPYIGAILVILYSLHRVQYVWSVRTLTYVLRSELAHDKIRKILLC
ncbi:PiggyBac transposable element-derived protein 2 [Trichinella nativa]|uniref:PiggyBac transposable element-derived protein 2 n=1 Tax=Trichinella nativa TaxID=6335 RepID=A0A0V1L678_9BILA|nr:PiggyBac transposable element-derived protein 2 [Trichinella nativa]